MSLRAGRAMGGLLAGLALLVGACSSSDVGEAGGPTLASAVTSSTTVSTSAASSTTANSDGAEEAAPVTITQSGDHTCVMHDDLERCWLMSAPPTEGGPVPLVIDFHGWTSNAGEQRSGSGFEELAESEGFVAAWPEGYESSFNAGGPCCPPATDERIDDVGFTRLLVSAVSDTHDIDVDRVYVTGLSNGCAMSQRIAAEASDLVAAVACMSLYLLADAGSDYAPVPVMELHGTDDVTVAYQPSALFDGAEANWSTWAELNGCTGEPVETWRSGASAAMTYQTCDAGSEVALVTIDQGGHILYPGAGTDIDTARLAWDFLRQHVREPSEN